MLLLYQCMQIFFFFAFSIIPSNRFCSSSNKRVKIALVLTLQAKYLMHILPKALLKWQLFMATESNLANERSPLCICHFDSAFLSTKFLFVLCYYCLKVLRFSLYVQRRINILYLSEHIRLYMYLLLVSNLEELM